MAPRVRIERTTSSLTAKRNYLCAIGELIGCRGRIRTCDLQLMRLARTTGLLYSAIIGAVDGTRTHLVWIDNPLPSPRTTTAYWYSERVSIPLLQLERLES